MKAINNWQFKQLGYIKYLGAHLSVELFCLPLINMNFFPLFPVTIFQLCYIAFY